MHLRGLSMRNLAINLAIAVTIAIVFAMVLSAEADSLKEGAGRTQIKRIYTVSADPYLPFQMIEPVY